MRVGLPHLGQSVLLEVSITFFRSAVFAILAIFSPDSLTTGTIPTRSISAFSVSGGGASLKRLGNSFEDYLSRLSPA